jgi:dTDP-4-amino-4,6-dideoxygalactose transaminase
MDMTGTSAGPKISVPWSGAGRQCHSPELDWSEAIRRAVIGGGCFAGRKVVKEFEERLAGLCGTRYAEATASGSAALLLALQTLEVGAGDEVVTVPNTFAASVEAVKLTGARPVLVDVQAATHTMDPEQIEPAISSRTKAIMPVHLYGRPAEMDAIRAIADEHGLLVIEEACHAAGARLPNRPCGSLGDVAAFSFGQSKPLASFGEAGAVTTSDEEIVERLRMLNRHGQAQAHVHQRTGFNFRMDPLEAAVLCERLRHRAYWLDRRRELGERYTQAFASFGIVRNPLVPVSHQHAFYAYVVEIPDRLDLQRHLTDEGIGWGVHYPTPIHRMKPHRDLDRRGGFPVVERLSEQILSLPVHPTLTDEEVNKVIEVVTAFFAPECRH